MLYYCLDLGQQFFNVTKAKYKSVRTVNKHFNQLKVAQAPDKNIIGHIGKGFDFLGYRFGEEKLIISKRTLENHISRLSQLYGQTEHQPNWKMLFDDYRQHWVTWVYSCIPSIINFDSETKLRLFLKSTKC